jgi:hypothetical protein
LTGRPARARGLTLLFWPGLGLAVLLPVAIAATSPYLAGRGLPYVISGFAGIFCLGFLLIQPVLAAGYLPGLDAVTARKWHRRVGSSIIAGVALHVGGLYLTSAPDTLDALLLVSPTPFSVYGVIAMWAVILTAGLVALRRKMGLRYAAWRLIHNGLAAIVVVATVVHALQIDGTMGTGSKWALCIAVLVMTTVSLLDLRVIRPLRLRRPGATG